MFGLNKIVQPKHYNLLPNTALVTRVFATLQGEGPFAGHPATFVRLTGCGLTCKFCDTFFDEGTVLDFPGIYAAMTAEWERVFETGNWHIPELVVLTGGEPLNQPYVTQLIQYLEDQGHVVQIETAGVRYADVSHAYVVMSPKRNDLTGVQIKVDPQLLDRTQALKFVIGTTHPFYNEVPEWALEWRDAALRKYHKKELGQPGSGFGPPPNIYVSPMNVYLKPPSIVTAEGTLDPRNGSDAAASFWEPNMLDLKVVQANHEYAALLARKHGFVFSMQQHLFASLP